MAHATPRRRTRQVEHTRQGLDTAEGLPFAEHLPAEQVQAALRAEGVTYRDRLFNPLVTLWVFLSQVLDPDHSCRQAVVRFLAFRAARGLVPCSPDPGAYCKARGRLPEGVLARLTRASGRDLLRQAPAAWHWHGRVVKLVDGTTVSMPDTPANQKAFPQARTQRPGVGFPIARLVVVFALAVGTVLDAALGPYQGKQTGELALFRALHAGLDAGDVVVADRYYCSYFEIAALQAWEVDVVTRLHQARRADFRRGMRLGPDDHLIAWPCPRRPAWMSAAEYATMPEVLVLREARVRVRQRGFRTRVFVVVTTLLEPEPFRLAELASLYRARWQAELDLRSLKVALQMDVLRGQSPEMVRKEVWAHLLGYNVIRALMAAAALQAGVRPGELSFTGAQQAWNAHWPHLLTAAPEGAARLWAELLRVISHHRVGDRPDRVEPRAVKRRPKSYRRLNVPRNQARARLSGKS